MQIEGSIEQTYNKMVNTRNGQAPVYHVVVDGQDVNCGFRDPGYEEGQFVTLNVENTNYGLKISTGGAPGRSKAPQTRSAGTAPSAGIQKAPRPAVAEFPVPKNTKGITIARQNSGGHAAVIVAALVNKGVIKTVEDAENAFFQFAYEITDFATGHREVAQAAAMAAIDE